MEPSRLRNVGIVAHIDAGKTTVSERILFYTGVEHRMGEVHDGNATMDWMEEERERGITITSAATTCPWREHEIQLIDTPGHVDFTVEVGRCLRVLDGAVVVLDGVAGVQAQTETVLRQAAQYAIPKLVLVNKMDRPGANFHAAVDSLAKVMEGTAVLTQLPIGSGEEFEGVVDLLRMKEIRWHGDGTEFIESEVSPPLEAAANLARDALCSRVAEVVDELADDYLENGTLGEPELRQGLRQAVLANQLVPVLAGAALKNLGIQPLLDAILDWLPSPLDRMGVEGLDPKTGKMVKRDPLPQAPFSALCFKVFHERYGDLTFVRVYSGTLEEGQMVYVPRLEKKERVQRLMRMHADSRVVLPSIGPGGIVAVSGLKFAQTGDTLCDPSNPIALEGLDFPEPVIRMTVEPQEPGDREKLHQALAVFDREDPTFWVDLEDEAGNAVIAGMGELHLEVAMHRLEREFGVKPRIGAPQVSWREFVAGPKKSQGRAEIRLDSQTHWVSVVVEMSPMAEVGSRPQLILALADGQNEISQELWRQCQQNFGPCGALGFPLSGVEIRLISWSEGVEGQANSADLLQGALYQAVSAAVSEGCRLVEPLMALEVEVPADYLSGVLADLSVRRAEVGYVDALAGKLSARVSLERMFAYSTDLRSLSQGRGTFSMKPDGYRVVAKGREAELRAQLGGG